MTEETLTATIDITHRGTAEHHVAGIVRIGLGLHLVTTYLTTADNDVGITAHNGHLTTAEDAAANLGFLTADADSRTAVQVTTMIIRSIRRCHTHTAAINAAVGVFNGTDATFRYSNSLLRRCTAGNLRTDGTTRNGNRSGSGSIRG